MRPSFINGWFLRQTLSLPAPLLRFLSGGGVVHTEGRTLDPRLQFLWRHWFAGSNGTVALSLDDKSLETVRQQWFDAAELFGLPDDARVRFEPVGGEGLPGVRGLLAKPVRTSSDAPLIVLFPQGGSVFGGSEINRALAAQLAHSARGPVFMPACRLAPEHRFPAALEDARAAFEWAQANAAHLGATSGRVAIGGVLTGANLAVRICLDLKRDFKPLPAGQLLITPLIDLVDPMLANSPLGLWPLDGADLTQMIAHYAGGGGDLSDPRLSPARESLIVGQPRTLVVSAGFDPTADQALAFVQRLTAARTSVVYRRYDTLPLGFDLFTAIVPDARAAVAQIGETFVELLRTDSEPVTEAA